MESKDFFFFFLSSVNTALLVKHVNILLTKADPKLGYALHQGPHGKSR